MKKTVLFLAITGYFFTFSVVFSNEQPLLYKSVVIDPGHGGFDNGAIAYGYSEDDINLSMSLYLKELLEKQGAKVYLTRNGDYDMTERDYNYSKADDMYLRVNKIDSYNADYLLSIHQNASQNKNAWGSQVFYYYKSEKGKELANDIDQSMKEKTNSQKPISGSSFRVLRATKTLGVLIECGFMSHQGEAGQLRSKIYQKELMNKIVEGLIKYNERNNQKNKEEAKKKLY